MSINIKNIENVSWSRQEQNYVKYLTEEKMLENWNDISAKVFQRYGKDHSGKQCRQRYINHIKFANTRKLLEWSLQQEELLFSKFQELGSKWSLIAQSFENKSQNCLKNKFYGSIRKLTRKLNSVGKQCKRLKKLIKFESLLKPFDILSFTKELNYSDGSSFEDLKANIIKMAKSQANQDKAAMIDLINKLNKFSLIARSIKPKKEFMRYSQNSKFIKSPVCKEFAQIQDLEREKQNFQGQGTSESHSNTKIKIFNEDVLSEQGKQEKFEFLSLQDYENHINNSTEDFLWPQQDRNDLNMLLFH